MSDPSSPANTFNSVTPHDDNDLTVPARALYVGVAGDLEVHNAAGVAVVFKNAAVGYHPIRTKRVLDSNTTATDIVSLE